LKFAIIEDGRKVADIAAAAGLSTVTVSGVITGRMRATPNNRARIAFALGRPEHELFPDAPRERVTSRGKS